MAHKTETPIAIPHVNLRFNQRKNRTIGKNIRELRKKAGIRQTELVRRLHLQGISITRECPVKIEQGLQHIQMEQLKAIKG